MSSSDAAADAQPGEALNEAISFLAPAIGSYYFGFTALDRVAAFYDANPLSMYRMAPVGKLPSKAPPPAMSVNLPPNATQAQRMQVRVVCCCLGRGRRVCTTVGCGTVVLCEPARYFVC
jgi:hypothetical protein